MDWKSSNKEPLSELKKITLQEITSIGDKVEQIWRAEKHR